MLFYRLKRQHNIKHYCLLCFNIADKFLHAFLNQISYTYCQCITFIIDFVVIFTDIQGDRDSPLEGENNFNGNEALYRLYRIPMRMICQMMLAPLHLIRQPGNTEDMKILEKPVQHATPS